MTIPDELKNIKKVRKIDTKVDSKDVMDKSKKSKADKIVSNLETININFMNSIKEMGKS